MFLPVCEADLVDFADSLASTVVVTSVPLGFSSRGISLDVGHACANDLEELELPVGVSSEGLDEALLVVVLVIDELVLSIVMADFSVRFGLRGELLDGGLDV